MARARALSWPIGCSVGARAPETAERIDALQALCASSAASCGAAAATTANTIASHAHQPVRRRPPRRGRRIPAQPLRATGLLGVVHKAGPGATGADGGADAPLQPVDVLGGQFSARHFNLSSTSRNCTSVRWYSDLMAPSLRFMICPISAFCSCCTNFSTTSCCRSSGSRRDGPNQPIALPVDVDLRVGVVVVRAVQLHVVQRHRRMAAVVAVDSWPPRCGRCDTARPRTARRDRCSCGRASARA